MQVKVHPYHINDSEFADALVDSFLEIFPRSRTPRQSAKTLESHSLKMDTMSLINYTGAQTIWRAPMEFPDAKPGSVLFCCSQLPYTPCVKSIYLHGQ